MICRKCGVDKDESEFTPSELKHGRQCKTCRKEYMKRHRANPEVKERIKEHQKQYREKLDVKERKKQYCKQYLSDPENMKRKKERQKQYYADPENKEHKREYNKQYRADPENKERIKECYKEYCADPKSMEHIRKYKKQYYARPEIVEHRKERMKQYYARPEIMEYRKERRKRYLAKPEVKECTKEYKKQYQKHRCATDPLYKITCKLRSLTNQSLKCGGYTKRSKSTQILGADFKTVQNHLGEVPAYKHHVDHICPITQAQNEEEAIKLCHYTNLRYLSTEENLQKSDRKTPEGEEMCRKLLDREWID